MDITDIFKNPGDLSVYEGTVTRIIFQNTGNGYTVCELDCSGEEMVAVGTLPYIAEGEQIKAAGIWTNHASFGRQFKIEYFEKVLTSSEAAIIKYLSSGLIRGVGKVTAKRIAERFGAETFDIIENRPEWLCEIQGITRSKADKIHAQFAELHGMRSVVQMCANFFPPSAAAGIYKKYGQGAAEVLRNNPYELCETIYGIDFEHADKMAASINIPKNDRKRVETGIRYVLKHNANNNGHLYIPRRKLIGAAASMLKLQRDEVDDVCGLLIESGRLRRREIFGEEAVYRCYDYECEEYCAKKLALLDRNGRGAAPQPADLRARIESIEKAGGIIYTDRQTEAINGACSGGVFVLTGGPGTGKTTVIKALIGIFLQMGMSVVLCAPTGRAAKRMTQATGMEARTLHRLLEASYEDDADPRFNRNEDNPLEFDTVIVDEASMVDIYLLRSLLSAMHADARIIFIGDADQLPSVGPGNVLRDILASGRFASVRLDVIFRQAEKSAIIVNAHRVNSGEYPDLSAKDGDFFFIERSVPAQIATTVSDLCLSRLPKRYGKDIAKKIQVITPSKKGAAGTANLNVVLQSALNPPAFGKREKSTNGVILREGDKIMQIRNNYGIEWTTPDGSVGYGIYNGDIGAIEYIDNINETVRICFDEERCADYDFSMLNEISHAFAITVHKSQGSEYPVVILPVSDEIARLHTRNLLYTAITRAQDMAIIVGTRESIAFMVDNNIYAQRYTGLEIMLRETD